MEYDIDIDKKPKSSNKKRKISNLLFPGNSSAFEKRQKKYFLFQASRRERETNSQISIREGCQKNPENHFSRTRHGIEWDMEDRRQRRQRIQGKQRRQKRQRKCHFYVPLFHFIFEWKCKLQFAKCRPRDAFIWRHLIKINTIKTIRLHNEEKNLNYKSTHSSIFLQHLQSGVRQFGLWKYCLFYFRF